MRAMEAQAQETGDQVVEQLCASFDPILLPAGYVGKSFELDRLMGTTKRQLSDFLDLLYDGLEFAREPFCLALIEVDNLKPLVDGLGSKKVCRLISKIGSFLEQCFSEQELVLRLHGGLFAVVLPFLDQFEAGDKVEQLRRQVASLSFVIDETTLEATLSVGLVMGNASDCHPEWLLQCAWERLLKARQVGRNCVVC